MSILDLLTSKIQAFTGKKESQSPLMYKFPY